MAAIVLSSVSLNSNAQGFYINAGLGYGFNAASQVIGTNYTKTTDGSGNTTTTTTNVKGSYAAGLNFGAIFGYMFNEHISGEIGINYLSGSTTTTTNSHTDSASSDVFTMGTKATMLRIIPAIKISGEPGTVTPYLKAGLVLGLSGKITNTVNGTSTTLGTSDVYAGTEEYTGGTSIGFMGAVGIDYKLSDMFSIYGEIGMIGATWAPTVMNVTAYTINGVDQLAQNNTSEKQTTFSSSTTTSSNVNPSPGSPTQSLQSFEPFSSWGINIGVHLTFVGKK